MAIWVLYTECDSEPTFSGYATSKKSAIEWMEVMAEDYDIEGKDIEIFEPHDGALQITVSDGYYIHAEKLVRIL